MILNPKGIIALHERDLIVGALLPMLTVVILVIVSAFFIAKKYRATNKKAKYRPNWDQSLWLQTIWWLIPSIIVFFLAIVTWQTAHALDPSKPIDSPNQPIRVQVVSLNWKWLFIYPDLDIATVNRLEFPVDTPLQFELTSDGPMNSFWIPQLGGQMYAMAGMTTKLNLMASDIGEYRGSAAEINGAGFAGMKFVAQAVTKNDFLTWIQNTKQSSIALNMVNYYYLSQPSENNPATTYSPIDPNLFANILKKYMPLTAQPESHH